MQITHLLSADRKVLSDTVRRFTEPPYGNSIFLRIYPALFICLHLVVWFFTAACQPAPQIEELQKYTFSEGKMGTLFRMVLYAEDSLTAQKLLLMPLHVLIL